MNKYLPTGNKLFNYSLADANEYLLMNRMLQEMTFLDILKFEPSI